MYDSDIKIFPFCFLKFHIFTSNMNFIISLILFKNLFVLSRDPFFRFLFARVLSRIFLFFFTWNFSNEKNLLRNLLLLIFFFVLRIFSIWSSFVLLCLFFANVLFLDFCDYIKFHFWTNSAVCKAQLMKLNFCANFFIENFKISSLKWCDVTGIVSVTVNKTISPIKSFRCCFLSLRVFWN